MRSFILERVQLAKQRLQEADNQVKSEKAKIDRLSLEICELRKKRDEELLNHDTLNKLIQEYDHSNKTYLTDSLENTGGKLKRKSPGSSKTKKKITSLLPKDKNNAVSIKTLQANANSEGLSVSYSCIYQNLIELEKCGLAEKKTIDKRHIWSRGGHKCLTRN